MLVVVCDLYMCMYVCVYDTNRHNGVIIKVLRFAIFVGSDENQNNIFRNYLFENLVEPILSLSAPQVRFLLNDVI